MELTGGFSQLSRALPIAAFTLSASLHASALGGLCWWGWGGGHRIAFVPFAAGESASFQVNLNPARARPRLVPASPSHPPTPELTARLPAPIPAPTLPQERAERAEILTQGEEYPRLDPLDADLEPPSIGQKGVRSHAKSLGSIQPEYPASCLKARHEGTCLLELWIDARGWVTDARVIESTGCEELDRSAVDAIRKARFLPELAGDGLLAARVTQRIRFELKG